MQTTTGDQALIQATFEAATGAINDMITSALQKGMRVDSLAVVVERQFDGRVVAGCALRGEVARRFGSDPNLPQTGRDGITRACASAIAGELPIIVLVHAEGYIAVGVRRERGAFGAVS